MKRGDLLKMRHGPVVAEAEVIDVNDRGAVIRYTGIVVYVGGLPPDVAPDGTRLTGGGDLSFIGRAHFAAFENAENEA